MNETDGFATAGTGATVGTDERPPIEIEPVRLTYARAATHGFGIGRIEAQRYLADLAEDELGLLREAMSRDPEITQGLAQERQVPFHDYIAELTGKGLLEQRECLDLVYRAAFDIGFRAYLIEAQNSAASAGLYQDQGPGMNTRAGESTESRLA